MRLIRMAALGLLALSAGLVHAANLVPNPSLETWSGGPLQADSWVNTAEASTYVQSATAQAGSFSAQVTPTATYAGIRQTTIAITGGRQYSLTAWMRGAGTGGDDTVRILAYTGGSDFFIADTTAQGGLGDGVWKQFTLSFTAPIVATNVELQFGAFQDPATNPISFLIDSVELNDVTPPPGGTPPNGNFETWSGAPLQADLWVNTNEASTYAQSATAHAGSFAGAVTPTAPYAGIRQLGIPVSSGGAYRLTAWMRGNGTGGNDDVRLLAYPGGSTFFITDTTSQGGLGDGVWKQFTLEFVVPNGTPTIEIQFGAFQDPATNPISFLIDDVQLELLTIGGNPKNGDFEFWTGAPLQANFWINTAEASTYAQSATVHGGSFAAAVTPTASYAGIRQQNLPVTAGNRYRLSAWMRGNGTGGDDIVRILVYDGTNFFVEATSTQGGLSDTEWREFAIEFTAAPGVTSVEVQFGAYQDPNANAISFLIDDVLLSDVTPLTGFPPNGDFEVWGGTPLQAVAWATTAEASTHSQSTTIVNGGSYAALVGPTATYGGIRQANLTVVAGHRYRLSVALRGGSTGGDDIVRLLAYPGGSDFFIASTTEQGGLFDNEWRPYVLEWTQPVGSTTIEIQIGAFQDPAINPIQFYVDDVVLTDLDFVPNAARHWDLY